MHYSAVEALGVNDFLHVESLGIVRIGINVGDEVCKVRMEALLNRRLFSGVYYRENEVVPSIGCVELLQLDDCSVLCIEGDE